MSIEGSSTATSHKPVTGDTSRMGKSKGVAGGASDAIGGAGAGFSALLNSFDSEFVDDDAIAPELAKDESDPTLQPPEDLLRNLFLPQNLPNDLALLLAQASEVSVDKFNSLPAATLETQLSAQVTPKAIPAAGILSLVDRPATDVALPVDLLLIQPGQGTQLRPLKGRVAEGLSGVGNAMMDSRMLNSSASGDVANRETALMGGLVSSGFGEALARPGDRSGGKPSFLLTGSGAEGIWGQSSFQAGPALETTSVTADSPTSSLESVVADTVSYWVTQGVKNAALKLDGFGEHPLEVNISMQGGEARIDFRTDQPEIRQILEGAMTDLKDLLKSEGVVLSGVSVGTSGQNGGGGQEGRDRPGARQGTVVTTKSSSADNPRPVNLPAGRVLDLFV